ncbi:hypothetical protein C6497_16925 [Candidatus Poribacteria bacterium]|nr:MAG: hypothetical protein C6497_16925 [Candidatus Poribacteria bacterium]
MINHLKEVYDTVYSPPLPEDYKLPYDVRPINTPYPYTDAKISVNTFDDPIQTVEVKVYNIGGGRLTVERISIPNAHGKWVKRKKSPTPTTLTASSEPHEIELNILLRELPNHTNVNVAKLKLISKPQRKTLSGITLEVHPPEEESTNLVMPEYINFGEITACKVSIADHREDESKPPVDFFLIDDFKANPPTSLEIMQRNENLFDAMMHFAKGGRYYKLDLRKPGVVKPRLKPNGNEISQKSVQQTFQIFNVNRRSYSGQVTTSDLDWLVCPTQINVAVYSTVNLSMSVKVEKLKQGRNFGELTISDKTIPVWAWCNIVNETTLIVNSDETDFHHIEEMPEQEKPLSHNIESTVQSCPTLMIFNDFDFRFPLGADDQVGYLIGDFNKWTPHTLFLEKRDDGFGATLSIPEGTYLYRAEIDGEMRLDPTRLNEIVCCSHGIVSKMQINRFQQKLKLNKITKEKQNIKLKSSTEWMQIEPDELVLTGSRKHEITLLYRPEYLQPGLNLGWIQVETTEEPIRSFHSPIYVMGKTNGAVPKLKNHELTFPQIEQGQAEEIPFELDIIGKGELKGEVQPSTVLRFAEGNIHVQSENAYQSMEVTSALQIISDKPSNAYRKQIHASLVTDCYLANRRLLPFIAKYDMIHLVSDPPALYFPKVYLFDDPQHADVIVKRSNGNGSVECVAEIPEVLSQSDFLKANIRKSDTCEFILNPQVPTNSGRVTDRLQVKDEKSGMIMPLQFAADIIDGQAQIEVEMQKQDANGIPLVITNIGGTELRIFEIGFKSQRFSLTPHPTSQQCTVLPGESIERHIITKKTISMMGKIKVRDTLIIRLNDPQYPNGIFEQDISVDIRRRLFNFRR